MNKLLCDILGHKYKLKRTISYSIREVKCTRCKQEFGMNDRAECILPMDDELIELHDDILSHQKLKLIPRSN